MSDSNPASSSTPRPAITDDDGQLLLPDALRPLNNEDAPRCAQLEKQLFGEDDPWSEQAFYYEFAGRTIYIGYEDNGVLVGYAGLAMLGPEDDPEFEIHTIGVDPDYRRQGIATLMLQVFVDVADYYEGPIFLECRTDNTAAVTLYQRYGFGVIDERKNYYQPSGADAYVMQRNPHGAPNPS